MTPGLVTGHSFPHLRCVSRIDYLTSRSSNPNLVLKSHSFTGPVSVNSPRYSSHRHCLAICSKLSGEKICSYTTGRVEENFSTNIGLEKENTQEINGWRVGVGSPNFISYVPNVKLSLSDQAFFLLAFIACTTSVAFISLVIAAVPTLHAMGRAAISLSKLADAAREELPSTMAAVRLTGMEISDLTLELSDLSQEIADGVHKSAQAVQAAEAGIRQIGSLAHQQTMSMIEERANLPVISIQPVVAGAAKKTTRAVSIATKSFINMISGREHILEKGDDDVVDRIEV